MTNQTATLAALIAMCQAGCQTEPRLTKFVAIEDARVWQDEPDTVFSTPGYVGISASLEGEEGNQHVVPHEQRVYLQFVTPSELEEDERSLFSHRASKVTGATLEFYVTSGTCRTSFDDHDCGLPIEVGVYAVLESFDGKTLTWGTRPYYLSTRELGRVTLQEDYIDSDAITRGEVEPKKYKVELPRFSQVLCEMGWGGSVYGLMLAPVKVGENDRSCGVPIDDPSERTSHLCEGGLEFSEYGIYGARDEAAAAFMIANQADVTLGTTEQGLPAELTITTARAVLGGMYIANCR